MREIVSSGSRRMRLAVLAPAMALSASICSPTVTLTPGRLIDRRAPSKERSRSPARRGESTAAGRGVPVADLVADRQDRLLACEGLADDAGKEPGGGLVGRSGAHADRRQAEADAVEEAAPRIVGEEKLADRLLGSV